LRWISVCGIVFEGDVYWHNTKYKTTGHLFQDRYKSEIVENEKYLLVVLRYIHHNPVKAGLCGELAEYPWGSYNEHPGKQRIVDTELVSGLLDKDDFEAHNRYEASEKVMENEERRFLLQDKEAREKMIALSGCNSASMFQKLDSGEIRRHISKFKDAGMSIRQISRLTGISMGIVESS